MQIDFLAVGHITHDRTPDGFRLGGTVSYAAVTARRLGWHPGILTRGSLGGLECNLKPGLPNGVCVLSGGDLDGVQIHLLPSPVSTTFSNIYRNGSRTQVVEAMAGQIHPNDLVPAWAGVPIVLLGPLVQELPQSWAGAFPGSIMGVTPQGWMRTWDSLGHVRPTPWANASSFLRRAEVVILSREDVGGDEDYIRELAAQARLLVVTDGYHGAQVYQGDASYFVPARSTHEVDPTGAGDVFATAFLIRYAETGDSAIATRFAHVVASLSVEGFGMSAIPDREAADMWFERNGW